MIRWKIWGLEIVRRRRKGGGTDRGLRSDRCLYVMREEGAGLNWLDKNPESAQLLSPKSLWNVISSSALASCEGRRKRGEVMRLGNIEGSKTVQCKCLPLGLSVWGRIAWIYCALRIAGGGDAANQWRRGPELISIIQRRCMWADYARLCRWIVVFQEQDFSNMGLSLSVPRFIGINWG